MALREAWKVSEYERDNVAAELTYLSEFCRSIETVGRRDTAMIVARLLDLSNRVAAIPLVGVESEETNESVKPPSKRPRAKGRSMSSGAGVFSEGPFAPSPFSGGGDRLGRSDRYVPSGSDLPPPASEHIEWRDSESATISVTGRIPRTGSDSRPTSLWFGGSGVDEAEALDSLSHFDWGVFNPLPAPSQGEPEGDGGGE